LLPRTEYCYAVRALDAAGNRSKPSATVCATTADPGVPAAPMNVQARPGGRDEVILSWDPSPDRVVAYSVYWDAPIRSRDSRVGTTPLTMLKVFGPAARQRHCYRVSAHDVADRESPKTPPVCVRATPAFSSR
jgi:hypothetical protein